MLGAVEAGRLLLDRAGGYEAVLHKIELEEHNQREARKAARERRHTADRESLRYR